MIDDRYTNEEICMLYRDAKNKKTQIQILTELTGLREFQIINILREGGYVDLDEKKKEEILKEYFNNSLSDSAIARKVGMAQSPVSKFLRSKGLPANGQFNKGTETIKRVETEKKSEIIEAKKEVDNTMMAQTAILKQLNNEAQENSEKLKTVLPQSIPEPESLTMDCDVDVIETLTPQQYYEMSKMTIQSINSMIELMRTIWEG